MILTFTDFQPLSPINNGMIIDCTAILLGYTPGDISSAVRLPITTVGLQLNEQTAYCNLGEEFRAVLEADLTFGNNTNDTFLYYESSGVSEAGIILVDIAGFVYMETVGVTGMVIEDTTSPAVACFELLDLGSGLIVITFTQAINVTTVNFSDLSFQDRAIRQPSSIVVSLTGGSCFAGCEIGRHVMFQMLQEDLDSLNQAYEVCTTKFNCFPHHTGAFAQDYGENQIIEYTNGTNYILQNLTSDIDGPLLLDYSLDLNIGLLTLTFQEIVLASSLNPSRFTLQGSFSISDSDPSVQLGGGTFSPTDGAVLNVTLDQNDLDRIKASEFATSINDTFLSLSVGAVRDTSSNSNLEILPSNALRAGGFTGDITEPTLEMFDFDLNSGTMIVYFSESIDLTSFATDQLTIFSDVEQYTISNMATLTRSAILRIFNITLNDQDLNEIKRLQLCGSYLTCNIAFPVTMAVDHASNPIRSRIINVNASSVNMFYPDVTPPELVDFVIFDLDEGLVVLEFTETVNVSSFNASGILLHDFFRVPVTQQIQFTGSTLLNENNYSVGFNLSYEDQNIVKSSSMLCIGPFSCYLRFHDGFIDDMAGNSIMALPGSGVLVDAEYPTIYIPDTTSPQLTSYSFRLYNGTLVLKFNEPVRTTTFDPAELTFQNALNATSSYTLTSGARHTTGVQLFIQFQLSMTDLLQIKAHTDLATSPVNTYIVYSSRLIRDTSTTNGNQGNAIKPRFNGVDALIVTNFINDITAPILQYFVLLDLNSGVLQVEFNEPVNISTFDGTKFVLQSGPDNNTAIEHLSLTGGIPSYADASLRILQITLNNDDVGELELTEFLGTMRSNSFLYIEFDAIRDFTGTPSNASDPTNALQVGLYLSTRPRLQGYSLDLNTGSLMLIFQEIVLVASLNLSRFTLQGSSSISDSDPSVQLGGGTFSPTDGAVLNVTLDQNDLDRIKASEFATSINDTFLSLSVGAVRDTSSNSNLEILPSNALRAGGFTGDITEPTLEMFDFDLNSGTMIVYFSESIDLTSFATDQLTIFSDVEQYTISNMATLTRSAILRIFNITLNDQDLNEIKRLQLCGSYLTCNIAFPVTMAVDHASNPIRSRIINVNASSVNMFYPDVTPPELVDFVIFDLDEGLVVLEFTETVNVSSFNASGILLHDFFRVPVTQQIQFTGSTLLNENNYSVGFNLSYEDQNIVKSSSMLCIGPFSCYLRFHDGFIDDMAGNSIMALPGSGVLVDAEYPTIYISDTTSPQLTSYSFRLYNGTLVLKFNEPVRTTTFDPAELTFQNALNATSSYTLTSGARHTTGVQLFIQFQLSMTDLLQIKAHTDLATSPVNTYIVYSSRLIRDTSTTNGNQGNAIKPRFNGADALIVTNFINDITAPILQYFVLLDLNSGVLQVEFNEPVNISTFDGTKFVLQSGPDNNTSIEHLSLTGGTPSYVDSSLRIIEIMMNHDDVKDLKVREILGTMRSNSFLFIDRDAIQNSAGIPNKASHYTDAFEVDNYIPDSTRPRLQNYSLNLNTGVLNFSFDDVMNASSLFTNHIAFQNAQSGGNQSYVLTGGNSASDNGCNILINLSEYEINGIKALRYLATSQDTTYLRMNSSSILDMAGLEVILIPETSALRANDFIPDEKHPELLSFIFDLGNNVINFIFSEVVDPVTLNASGIIVQNTSNYIASEYYAQYTLTGGQIEPEIPSKQLVLAMSNDDVNNIKSIRTLGTNVNTTFLVIGENTIQDMNGNELVAISYEDALRAQLFDEDKTRPTLVSFELDLNQGIVFLKFSETVDPRSFNPESITIQSAPTSPLHERQLTGGAYTMDIGPFISLSLNLGDLKYIKQTPGFASFQGDTYMALTSDMINDTSMNRIVEIPTDNAKLSNFLTLDITPPLLLSFDFDLNAGEIVLIFSETVDVASIDVSRITLVNRQSSIALSFNLSSSQVVSSGSWATLYLSTDDLNGIKAFPSLAVDNRSVFITVQNFSVLDVSGNGIAQIMAVNAVPVDIYTADTEPPTLDSIEVHLVTAPFKLIVLFSETVNFSSVDLTQWYLTDNATNTLQLYGTVSKLYSSEVIITLSASVLDSLHAMDNNLGIYPNNVYLHISSGGVSDMAAVPIMETMQLVNVFNRYFNCKY